MRGFRVGFSVAAMALMALSLRAGAQDDPGRPEFYSNKVKPIFDEHCARCHGGMNRRGGLNISTRAGMLKGGRDGVVLIPGDPDRSLLVRLMQHMGPASDPMPMPPKLPKLPDDQIAIVYQWVKAGALMPDPAAKP